MDRPDRAPAAGVGSAGDSGPTTAGRINDVVTNAQHRLQSRIVRAAESALAERKVVSPIDVLIGVGWLAPSEVDRWRQGRIPYLEAAAQVNLGKLSTAMKYFRGWARDRGLRPSETAYVARTRDRRSLRFSKSGDPDVERAYRTHWVSPELSPKKRQHVVEQQNKPPDLVVIWPRRAFTRTDCGESGEGLLFMEGPGPLCLACADLDHLVFLPSGDAALTRRARQGSRLSAVVVRFSTTRKRYERQGILVEEPALADAERQCLADEESRARRRERDRVRRAEQDLELQARTVEGIRRIFPGCPVERAEAIARHATVRGSGRIGRTAPGRALDPEAITLAVTASVRHHDTAYNELLMAGVDRNEARRQVHPDVQNVLDRWH